MQRLRRFARYWDLVANSGNFVETTPLLWATERRRSQSFLAFQRLAVLRGSRRTHTIALATLARELFGLICRAEAASNREVCRGAGEDWRRQGAKDLPPWLEEHQPVVANRGESQRPSMPRRQAKHVGA